jgi:threonine-phosphate decarboxylase
MLHGHGDDGYLHKQEIVADFSTNVWYGGEPAGLKDHLFEKWEIINKYPEVIAESLREKVAEHHHLDTVNLLVTNGTTESIYLVGQAFKNTSTTIVTPAFSEYEDACKMHNLTLQFLPWEELDYQTNIRTPLVFICNPNNPTGAAFHHLEALIENNPTATFVVDEAFIDFTFSIQSIISLINRFKNLIILRSLTKAFAIPGLRLGYIAAHADIIERLQLQKAPWTVNAMAIEAGKFIFDHYKTLQLPLKELLNDKQDFIQKMQEAEVKTYESHTHFFIAETAKGTARELKQYLLDNFGILIRDASNFRGLSNRHFRLATLAPSQNQLLVNALKQWKNIGC